MVETLVLSNGLRVVSEKIESVRSCSLGVWINTGSRHEPPELSGAAHFIEHMLFKGTSTRSASDLAQFIDSVGGHVNAYTSKERTCFFGRVVDTKVSVLAEVFCDMILNSKFNKNNFASERKVIIEEISMSEDTPDDLAAEITALKVFLGGLAHPVLGTKTKLRAMTADKLHAYQREKYVGENIVVAIAGSFTQQQYDDICNLFAAIPRGEKTVCEQSGLSHGVAVKRKDIEQNHVLLTFPGFSVTDDRVYAMQLFSDILGGGMSSRLFQELREKRGLCYSTYSYASCYSDCGTFSVYTAVSPQTEAEALRVITTELHKIAEYGVTAEELLRTKEQIGANLLLALESTSSRMNRLGNHTVCHGRVIPIEETLNRYETVSQDDIISLAKDVLDFTKASVAVVGDTKKREHYGRLISG